MPDLPHFKDLQYNLDLRNNCHVSLGDIMILIIYTMILTCDLERHGHICVSWFRFFQHIKTNAFMFQCRKLELPLHFTESLKHCNKYVPSYYVEHYETLMSRRVYIRKMKLLLYIRKMKLLNYVMFKFKDPTLFTYRVRTNRQTKRHIHSWTVMSTA